MDINKIGHNNLNYQKINKKYKAENSNFNNEFENQKNALNVSGESMQYIELAKKLPNVRTNLVEEYKKQIENNNYEINHNNIVNKMLGGK
ncbi:flagellar biosynthesis anti-sigma factor FlgM [Oceanotoga sp. DSM 15011]|jgi:anti-sigma28 factor (negative regulator of flagellin synthesis)|uniref:flagellar biosynthesis anti-sigma factor FlgM n=1 Tax=Oceanotoga TaxID=1255275 RepID=UPI0021F4ECA8|nr:MULTISPECIES: flagellar biosynthesis anti-sigma factor FlgM [Oceanotoga]MDN5342346.1 Anti-sigma-28 factor, FlgM [Oceanotoga sp.]MDO7976115.1 flagellar biosynthesis anti-sigma factor FlgM [Oceanotoga teriensis]UYP00951.1 flagellar biosynthesis anti-sigma factor FlgM [Oceanotoga sp. DSM 15011]